MKVSSPIVILYWGITAWLCLIAMAMFSPLLWLIGWGKWTFGESDNDRTFRFTFEQSFYKVPPFLKRKDTNG